MRKIPKRLLSLVLSLSMMLAMLPVGAMAAGGDSGDTSTSGIELSKTATLEDDGTYTIDLEAYATGTVTSTAEKQPLDIILVLDQSGSMAYDFSGSSTQTNSSRRQYAMKAAVDSFIDAVYDDSTELDGQDGDVEHRVGIVTFGSSSSTLCSLQSVETGYNTLTGAVSGLPDQPTGATNTSAGMSTANNMIDTTTTGRQTIVILFTDGVPTTASSFSKTVADSAISTAKSMKDKGAIVYTVGIFSGVDTTYIGTVGDSLKISGNNNNETEAANRFMNLVSSNTTTATDMGMTSSSSSGGNQGGGGGGGNNTSYTITTNYDYSSKGYYKTATSASELENVFSEIQKESAGTTVTLDSESVLKDIMGDGFELSVSDASCVTVQTADYLGNGEFDTAVTFSDAVVTVENNTVSVSGFDYKSNYVVNASGSVAASGKKLIVTITGVLPTTDVTTGEAVNTNDATSGIYATAEATEATATFPQPQTIITKKLYVLDYAKTASLTGLDQDTSVTGIVSSYQKVTAANSSLTQSYGASALNNNTLSYTPTTMQWDGYDSLYVFGKTSNSTVTALKANSNGNLWSKVSVIPANNVYYEDDFVTTYTDETKTETATVGIEYTGDWTTVYSDSESNNTETANGETHGWETSLSDDTEYSDGSAHAANTTSATATFTFTGTGVDIYSRTDMDAGKVKVTLKGTSEENTTSKVYICNSLSESGTYYQIPTVSFEELEYDTYTVTIKVATNATDNEYTYYLDGVRVYNPLGETVTGDAEEAYAEDNELNAVFTEVRNILIDANSFTDGYSGAGGVVFIDNNVYAGTTDESGTENSTSSVANEYAEDGTLTSIGTYEDLGPKNEVYLAAGQSIAFKVEGGDNYYLGLKAPSGSSTTATVTNGTGTSDLTIKHSTDLYYEIKPTSDGYIMVENSGSSLLSITKLRSTSASSTASGIALLSADEVNEVVAYAATFDSLKSVSYTGSGTAEDDFTDTDASESEDTTETEEPSDDVVELDEDDIVIDNPTEDTDDEQTEESEGSSSQSAFSSLFDSIRNWFNGRR